MKTWIVRVTETRDHEYEIDAETAEEALKIYDEYGDDQLKELDIDGNVSWDSPWDIDEKEVEQ
jgi:hypothetical protein